MLAEFPSAVLALRAAIGIQDSLRDRNAGAPAGQLLELRMAVHQGDVIVENSDLLGDGVNIAARLETSLNRAASAFRLGSTKTRPARLSLMRRTSANKS
jgi:class 3 adenylate cyclase